MLDQPFMIPSIIFIILAIPLILSIVPINKFYGIRTKKTMSDASVWYRANRFGGMVLILSGIFYMLISFEFPATGKHDHNFYLWLIHLSAFILPIIIGFIITTNYIKRL